jgi:hypothetical protein
VHSNKANDTENLKKLKESNKKKVPVALQQSGMMTD